MSGPIRGMRNVEGKLLVVSGNQLYQISNSGVAIPRGTVPGVGPVQMSHNQKGNGNEVIIVNGSAGYIYNTSTLVFAKITDEGYPGAKCVAYLASYFLQVEPAGRFWFHSDLADGFAYNTLDRYESEAAPDRIVGLIDSQLEVIVFNETTTEFFVNTGAATGTFQSKGIVIETGCAGSNAYAKLDNSVMWLDDKGVVQRMEGYSARPISTRLLERQISKYKAQWSNVMAMTWEDKGHKVFYLTFPNGYTFGYDVTTGVWTRRQSWGMDRWRLSCLVYWNKKWIGGDYQQDKLYELDWRYMYDGRDPHIRRATTGFISNDQRRLTVPSAEVVFDTGGTPEPIADFPIQPEGPTVSGALPDGVVGTSWPGGAYTAVGGTPPITFTSRTGTTFPGDLGPMNASGVVAAETPNEVGQGVNIVRATDANGLFDELTDEFSIVTPIALFGESSSASREFVLLGSGSNWAGPYAYNGTSPLLNGVSILAGGGRYVVWPASSGSPWISTDDTATTWTTAAATFSAASKLNDGAYKDGVWLIPGNDGVWRSADNFATAAAVGLPAGWIACGDEIAMSVSIYDPFPQTSPSPYSTWTPRSDHGIELPPDGAIAYGNGRFLIVGNDGAGGSKQPKGTFTETGSSYDPQTFPACTANTYAKAACYSPAGIWLVGTDAGQFLMMDEADGIWHLCAYSLPNTPSEKTVMNIVHDGVQFVIAGDSSSGAMGGGIVVLTEDGVTFTVAPTFEPIKARQLAVMK